MLDTWWLFLGATTVVLVAAKFISHHRHPLSKFPGPLFCALSNIPYAYHFFAADHPRWMSSLHEKYGPVVRVAPNELAFISPQAFRDIYGFRGKGHGVFVKTDAYDAAAFTAQARSVVNERDPAEHARMRKMLAPAFSDRALREQWPLIFRTSETLITEIGKHAKTGQPLDLAKYFSCITFDIITNLALGESFDSVTAGKIHPWQVFFMNGARAMGEALAVARFPLLKSLVIALQPPQMRAMVKELRSHEEFTIELVKKRQQICVDRPDIIGLILDSQKKEGAEYSSSFIAAQLSDVVIAGTDTTATGLASTNFYLLTNPEAMRQLQSEIRNKFRTYEEITPQTTSDLSYLNAVLSEGLRLFAPVSWPPGRVVPTGGDTVDGYSIPAGTWVSAGYYTASRSPENFQDSLQFRPERWLAKSTDKLDASQPFGMGTRACIGKQLALTEMRLIMAKLHFKYDLEMVDKTFDWVESAEYRLLWKKPPLIVNVRERGDFGSKSG